MIDFERIARESQLYNFHSHTPYCDGHAPMRDFVEEAIRMGFTDWGFTPHSPVPIASPCNIKLADVERYLSDFEKLRREFDGRIRLYKSFEIDYLNDEWNARNPLYDDLDLDYKLSSVHFVPCGDEFVDTDGRFESFRAKMSKYFDNDIESVVRLFYRQTLKMIECGGFDIIGHFDKIGQNAGYFRQGIENEPWYKALILEVVDAICDSHLIVEINTKSLAEHGRFFPNERYFGLLKQRGVQVIFNSDSHYPERINAGRMEAINIYKNI